MEKVERKENAVYSGSVFSGKRMYFVDVRKASNNSNYLVISESVVDKEGNRKRNTIMLFSSDFQRFMEELKKTESYFPEQVFTNK
ncbi:MAG: DUF3276 family protein [Candidatus Firestonebacteria bacterium]